MTGRHRRRPSNIITAIKIAWILVAVLFLIMGSAWIILDIR